MFAAEGAVRPAYARFAERLAAWNAETLEDRQRRADLDLLNSGITFTVYRDDEGTERIFPFSLIPRIVAAAEWQTVEQGLAQRVRALNAFLADIYHEQRCVTDEVIPADILFDAPGFVLRMVGFTPPLGVYIHISGSDLIRDQQGQFRVLEDNVRTPLGRVVRPGEPARDAQRRARSVRGRRCAGQRLPRAVARHADRRAAGQRCA